MLNRPAYRIGSTGWTQNPGETPSKSAGPMTLGLRRFALEESAPKGPDLTGQSRIFLDSGKVEDYASMLPLGMIWGVTTNPTILSRAGVPCTVAAIRDLAAAAFSFGAQEFMAQTWGGPDVGALLDHGLKLAAIDPRVVVKVPATAAGLEAATLLRSQGVRICLTAIYSSHQAVSGVAVGAEYFAPYLGRMNDSGKDGLAEIACMQSIVDKMHSKTRVLVASVRSANEVADLAGRGCTTFTLSADVLREMVSDPQTTEAAADFEKVRL
jgi:transaldolase